MNPEKLTAELRRIASAIMASNAPSRAAVRRDLEGLVRRVADDEKVSKRRAWHFVCEECKKDRDRVETDTVVFSVTKPTSPKCPLCTKTMSDGKVENQQGITELFKKQNSGNLPKNDPENNPENNPENED